MVTTERKRAQAFRGGGGGGLTVFAYLTRLELLPRKMGVPISSSQD